MPSTIIINHKILLVAFENPQKYQVCNISVTAKLCVLISIHITIIRLNLEICEELQKSEQCFSSGFMICVLPQLCSVLKSDFIIMEIHPYLQKFSSNILELHELCIKNHMKNATSVQNQMNEACSKFF